MKRIVVLPSFERSVKRLTAQEKKDLAKSLEVFNAFLTAHRASYGFRFKKINHDKYEFRIDVHLRVVVKAEDETYYLVLAGNHEDVRRYLRNYR